MKSETLIEQGRQLMKQLTEHEELAVISYIEHIYFPKNEKSDELNHCSPLEREIKRDLQRRAGWMREHFIAPFKYEKML